MSIFFTPDDRPCCKYCGQELPGYSLSGHCPHCGKWYAVGRATIAPSRVRAIALLLNSHRAVTGQVSGAWTGFAATGFILGNAAVVMLIGWLAVRALYRSCGMQW